ncbi:microtubule-binding stalk of dynein motor-domain-containing protein, partial [Baffinella frigidus]
DAHDQEQKGLLETTPTGSLAPAAASGGGQLNSTLSGASGGLGDTSAPAGAKKLSPETMQQAARHTALAALEGLYDIETAIEDQKQVVEQRTMAVNRMLAQVGQENASLEEQRARLREDEGKLAEIEAEIATLQAALNEQVDMAGPLLEDAEAGLVMVDHDSIAALRGMVLPSEDTLQVAQAVVILLSGAGVPDHRLLQWKEVKKHLKPESFLSTLSKFNVKNAHPEAVEQLEANWLPLPTPLEGEEPTETTALIAGLSQWVTSIVKMFHIYTVIKPKQSQLKELTAEKKDLMKNFQDAAEEKNSSVAGLENLTASCNIAGKLAQVIKSSRSNPIQDALDRTEQQLECLLGDTLVAAALVTYSGHLDLRGRSSFIETGRSSSLECLLGDTLVAAALVTYSGHLDLRRRSSFIEQRECLMGDTLVAAALVAYSGHLDLRGRSSFIEDTVLADLRAQKIRVSIPPTLNALDNVLADLRAQKIRVSIPPTLDALVSAAQRRSDGIALDWLTMHYTPPGSRVTMLRTITTNQENLIEVVRACVQDGRPLAIYGGGGGGLTTINRELMELILRKYFVRKRATVVNLGAGEPVEVHPKFRLFLVTGRNKASAEPEHLSTFTIVNFTLCAAGIAESTLAAMLRTQLIDVGPRQENLLTVQGPNEAMSNALAAMIADDLVLMDKVVIGLEDARKEEQEIKDIESAFAKVVLCGEMLHEVANKVRGLSPAYEFPPSYEADEAAAATVDGKHAFDARIVARIQVRPTRGSSRGSRCVVPHDT